MSFNSWNGSSSGNHEVNLTPLIDVSLVLVVMLLLATPLAFESSIKVNTTPQTAQAAQESERDENIEIVVLDETQVRINRTVVARTDMDGTLRPLLEKSKKRRVMIGCEAGVTHGAFVGVMDAAKLCGATDIAVFERDN